MAPAAKRRATSSAPRSSKSASPSTSTGQTSPSAVSQPPSQPKTAARKRRTSAEIEASKIAAAERKREAEYKRQRRARVAEEKATLQELKLRAEIGERCRASREYQLAPASGKDAMRERFRQQILEEKERKKAKSRRKIVLAKEEDGMNVGQEGDEGAGDRDEDGDGEENATEENGARGMRLRSGFRLDPARQRETLLAFRAINRRHMSEEAAQRLAASESASSHSGSPLGSSPPVSAASLVRDQGVPSQKVAASPVSSTSSLTSVESYQPVDMVPGVFMDWNPNAWELMLSHYQLTSESAVRYTPLRTLSERERHCVEALFRLRLQSVEP